MMENMGFKKINPTWNNWACELFKFKISGSKACLKDFCFLQPIIINCTRTKTKKTKITLNFNLISN